MFKMALFSAFFIFLKALCALVGHYKIKRNKQGYQLVYGVQDDVLIVMVMAVDKRQDSVVYQSAIARVSAKIIALNQAVKKHTSP